MEANTEKKDPSSQDQFDAQLLATITILWRAKVFVGLGLIAGFLVGYLIIRYQRINSSPAYVSSIQYNIEMPSSIDMEKLVNSLNEELPALIHRGAFIEVMGSDALPDKPLVAILQDKRRPIEFSMGPSIMGVVATFWTTSKIHEEQAVSQIESMVIEYTKIKNQGVIELLNSMLNINMTIEEFYKGRSPTQLVISKLYEQNLQLRKLGYSRNVNPDLIANTPTVVDSNIQDLRVLSALYQFNYLSTLLRIEGIISKDRHEFNLSLVSKFEDAFEILSGPKVDDGESVSQSYMHQLIPPFELTPASRKINMVDITSANKERPRTTLVLGAVAGMIFAFCLFYMISFLRRNREQIQSAFTS